MIIIILKKGAEKIELLINAAADIAIITENTAAIFELAALYRQAFTDFMTDCNRDFEKFELMTDALISAGIIGYPITPMKDARLYALDNKITIDSEIEIIL
jgi:hypothetical protein